MILITILYFNNIVFKVNCVKYFIYFFVKIGLLYRIWFAKTDYFIFINPIVFWYRLVKLIIKIKLLFNIRIYNFLFTMERVIWIIWSRSFTDLRIIFKRNFLMINPSIINLSLYFLFLLFSSIFKYLFIKLFHVVITLAVLFFH